MEYHFTKHFGETLKKRYGIELTDELKSKIIDNIDKSKPYKLVGKGRSPALLVYIGDLLYEYIAVAYDDKTQTFISALAIGLKPK